MRSEPPVAESLFQPIVALAGSSDKQNAFCLDAKRFRRGSWLSSEQKHVFTFLTPLNGCRSCTYGDLFFKQCEYRRRSIWFSVTFWSVMR